MYEVRRRRQSKGWSQNELAFHANLATSVISQIETGKREPSATTLHKLAKALDVEVPDLFGRAESPKAEAPTSQVRDAEEEQRDLRAWFSLGLVTEYLESLYTTLDDVLRNAPDDPDLEKWQEVKAGIEAHYEDFKAMQRSVRSRGIDKFVFQYVRALQDGEYVPADIREAIDAYLKAQGSFHEDLLPRASEWITEHAKPLNRQAAAEKSSVVQQAVA